MTNKNDSESEKLPTEIQAPGVGSAAEPNDLVHASDDGVVLDHLRCPSCERLVDLVQRGEKFSLEPLSFRDCHRPESK